MTLYAEITTGPLAATLAPFVVAGNHAAIADALNVKTLATGLKTRIITARGVMSDYPGGPTAAAAVLDKLEAAAPAVPALRWAMGFIKGEGLDIGHTATQNMLDQLVTAGVITAIEAANLKALGQVLLSRAEIILGHSVTHIEVAVALQGGI